MSTKNTTYNRCSIRPLFSCKQSLTVLLKFYCIVSSSIPSIKNRGDLNLRTDRSKHRSSSTNYLFPKQLVKCSGRVRFGRMWWCTILHKLSLNACGFSCVRKYSLRIFVIPHLLNIVSSVNGIFTGELELRWTTKLTIHWSLKRLLSLETEKLPKDNRIKYTKEFGE